MDEVNVLNTLNTASREELLRMAGFGPAIVDQLLEARPFDTIEDVTKVRGITMQKLEHLSNILPPREEPTHSPVTAIIEAPAPQHQRIETPESSSINIGRIIVFLFRLILTLAVLAGIAALIYFGTPYVYSRYVQPVENNTTRLGEMEAQQAADAERLTAQITELQNRVTELEGRVQSIETAIKTHDAELARLDQLEKDLQSFSKTMNAHVTEINSSMDETRRQITQLKILTLLSRSRLYLSQSNFGFARQDVAAARDLLVSMQGDLPDHQRNAAQAILARLDLALGNLPEYPVLAASDVDIAWQMMIAGLPTKEQAAAATALPPTASATVEAPTSTPTPFIETVTPTP